MRLNTITQAQADDIAAYLLTNELPIGVGVEHAACSAAAINLALGFGLNDDCPDCASPAIWAWMIHINDAMPHAMRNSAEWKNLLPYVAGTGRGLEIHRQAVALDWMWAIVMPQLQPAADAYGYGKEWLCMTTLKTADAYEAAVAAADAYEAADAAADAAACAVAAADAYEAAGAAADAYKFWAAVDPIGCLRRMLEIEA